MRKILDKLKILPYNTVKFLKAVTKTERFDRFKRAGDGVIPAVCFPQSYHF